MSDLTRRVLDVQKAHENLCKRTGLPLPASMDDMETLATAAPVLARQVEAVEELLAYAEEPTAFRIRRALRDAEDDATNSTTTAHHEEA